MKAHVEDGISAYFEGRLTGAAERDALFGHLDRCDGCRERFDAIAEADRLLAGVGPDVLPATQLEAIRASVLEPPLKTKPKRAAGLGWWASWLIPAAAAAAALFVAYPRDTFTAKGGAVAPVQPTVEVLCFDEDAQIVAHLEASGTCPAPGFIKVIYASAETIPHLLVAAREGGEIRFATSLVSPKPRSVVPEHVKIDDGTVVEIIVLTEEPPHDEETLAEAKPVIVVTGVAR